MNPNGPQAGAGQVASAPPKPQQQILAPSGVTSLKCPNCGAQIAPKFGEMIITCEYCGGSVTLGDQGWANIQKQTMLPLKIASVDQVNAIINPMMDKGLLHRHLQETSTQEEMSLSYVPYWVVSVSATTSVVTANLTATVGQTATEAALFGVILGGGGFGRRAYWNSEPNLFKSGIFGSMMGFGGMGMGYGGGGYQKAEQMDANYDFPVIALKALTAYQPKDYQFSLEDRTLFDISKLPKGIKVLNGDISEEAAKSQAKTLVDQLQSQKSSRQISYDTENKYAGRNRRRRPPSRANLVCSIRSQGQQNHPGN